MVFLALTWANAAINTPQSLEVLWLLTPVGL
jgi:hypothetical protein